MKETIRHDWKKNEIQAIYQMPFNDLIYRAQQVHRQHFDPNQVQLSTLLSVKTGKCPEDCAYCPQTAHYPTGVKLERLMSLDEVLKEACRAKEKGATRFCMGAAWREPDDRDMPPILEMIRSVKALGMETCVTLGLLTESQACQLKEAGLDFYNHNLDTSPEFYPKIITTRTYQDRLDTLALVRKAGIKMCCGGIVGMGETLADRIGLLQQLVNLPEHPRSVTINFLIPIPGTPLQDQPRLDSFEFVRMVATARIIMPKSFVRLSAGRNEMNEELHALGFLAGANSIHFGDSLLVTDLPESEKDLRLLERLGITSLEVNVV